MKPIKIGILSDTHLVGPNDDFRKQAAACFVDASIILHAGDLTDTSILEVFRNKEVHAVHGNMCHAATRATLPCKKEIQAGAFRIGLIHRVGNTYDFEQLLYDEFPEADCIVYGHTHRPVCRWIGSVLLINPGSFMSSGRYGSPGTYALLEVGERLTGTIYEVRKSI